MFEAQQRAAATNKGLEISSSQEGQKKQIVAKNRWILVSISGSSGAILYDHARGHRAWIVLHEHKSANNIWYTGAQAKWIRFNKIYLYALTAD